MVISSFTPTASLAAGALDLSDQVAHAADSTPGDQDREELRRLIHESMPDLANRSPAVLGPATAEPVNYDQ